MPTIEITREQLAYVEALREELEDEVPYGQVRNLDAVQYLIDHHREDGDLDVEIDADLAAKLDAEEATDGGAVPTETGGSSAADAGDASTEPTDADTEPEETDSPTASDPADAGGSSSMPNPNAVSPGGSGGSGDSNGSGDATTTRVSGGPDPNALTGSGSDKVNEMMNLLSAHEDKWEEASSGDAKYQVELPDGAVESAATKDDVRAVLFKNYR